MKSEPSTFGIDQLAARPRQIEPWDGVRNYQARTMLRDQMRVGDQAFFYHSNCAQPGVVGLMEVVKAGYPDPTAFDPEAPHYDPKSDPARPTWYLVEVHYLRHLARLISLQELRRYADGPLQDLPLLRRCNRLSVMPVTPAQWDFILSLERGPDP
jgi:predicted RNA-binding protein with PUA-like domain